MGRGKDRAATKSDSATTGERRRGQQLFDARGYAGRVATACRDRTAWLWDDHADALSPGPEQLAGERIGELALGIMALYDLEELSKFAPCTLSISSLPSRSHHLPRWRRAPSSRMSSSAAA